MKWTRCICSKCGLNQCDMNIHSNCITYPYWGIVRISLTVLTFSLCLLPKGFGYFYIEFEQRIRDRQNAKALEVGHDLFKGIVSKYSETRNIDNLQKRLEVAHDLSDLITRILQSYQQKVLLEIVNVDMLQELSSIPENVQEATYLLPPAEQLYLVNLPIFSGGINVQGALAKEVCFLCTYYDLRMLSLIEKVANATAEIMITSPESLDISSYSFILPLLYLSEEDHRWSKPGFLLKGISLYNLDAMSDFCLLRAERPKTALAIDRYKAKLEGRKFSLVDWTFSSSARCIEFRRPDLAEQLLMLAINDICDEPESVQLRLKIAENCAICGDNNIAEIKCKQFAENFPDSHLCGKEMCSYFACLATRSKAEKILAEIDSALEMTQCKRYISQLMYLKWWALCETNQHVLAKQIGEQLIENHGDNPCISSVLATDALLEQHYSRCRKLLLQITRSFPRTESAKRARKILSRIGRK